MSGKREIVSGIREAMDGLEKKDVEQMVTLVFAIIADMTKKGERVTIRGFGSFEVKRRRQKKGRNPQTGEDMMIAAHDVLTLKQSEKR